MIGLALLGSLSPLFTFTALFQQKEWRLDRLREHLRHEGFWNQTVGNIQPLLLFLWVVGWLTQPAFRTIVLVAVLCAFALKTLAQWFLHKQRKPVRTAKALAIDMLAVVLTAAVASVMPSALLPILPPMQPLFVLIAWAILQPLDRYAKNRVFRQAREARDEWHEATVIGIAGSVGKTTTKELLKHVLQDLSPIATPEHVNSEMGVAQWMLSERSEIKNQRSAVLIVEMGAYKKGEIALMCSFVKPTIGVITALGSDHLALFGSEEAIIDANAELIESLPPFGHAFLYADNEVTRSLEERCPCPVTLAGLDERSTVKADHTEMTDKGLQLMSEGKPVEIALHGLHNVGNILLAVAVAQSLGIKNERIAELLASFHPLTHTFRVFEENGVTVLDDTYNSSRLSISAALDWARHQTEKPKALLMSDLQEAGQDEDRFLVELGSKASSIIDRVIFTTDTGRAAFEKGYGKTVELLANHPQKVASGSLLLCLGRMPLSFIQKLLPE